MNTDLPQPASTLPEDLDSIIAGLYQAMVEQCGINRFIAPICVFIGARLLGTASRFAALFARWREGRLLAPRLPAPRPPASHPRPERDAAASEPKPVLPRNFGWLVSLVPAAEVYGAVLQHFLTNPDMAAFMAEAPHAGRMLRPLCWMLGVKPLPQMLRPQNLNPRKPAPDTPTPDTPTPDTPSPETPAGKGSSAATKAAEARRWFIENITPRVPRSLPEDLRSVRPVSFWCRPVRSRL